MAGMYKTPGFEISYEKLNQTEYNLTSNMGGMAVVEYLAKSKLGKYYTFMLHITPRYRLLQGMDIHSSAVKITGMKSKLDTTELGLQCLMDVHIKWK